MLFLNAAVAEARTGVERPPLVQSAGRDTAQSTASSFRDSASSKSEAGPVVDSLRFQQLSLSDSSEGAPASSPSAVPVARGTQLQPPCYFSNTQDSAQLQQGASAAGEGSSQNQQELQQPTEAHQEPPQPSSQHSLAASQMANPKLALNSYCQRKGAPPPHYDCTYPDDAVGYIATVAVDGRKFTSKPEGTKRAAEATAARMALMSFGLNVEVQGQGGTNGHTIEGELKESDSSIAGKLSRA